MKHYNNEILNDCSWFAEKHRGKNKQSGAHWSTIIRFTPLFDEAVRLQNQVRTLLKSIEIGDSKQLDIDILQARVQELEQERRWIPVSESKPKSGVPVLVWNGGLHTAFWFEQQDDTPFGGHWVWHPVRKNIYTFMLGVTHWQPLPQPPQEEE